MKRYLVFAGETYYPLGGWDDLRGRFDTVEDAVVAVTGKFDWWQVVDIETGEVVKELD